MDKVILHSFRNDTQYFSATTDGSGKMKRTPLTNFIQNLIFECGTFSYDSVSLSTSSLDYNDKKHFLSYIYPISLYEWIIEDPVRERAIIEEEEPHLQKLIDENCDEVFSDWREDKCAERGDYPIRGDILFNK